MIEEETFQKLAMIILPIITLGMGYFLGYTSQLNKLRGKTK